MAFFEELDLVGHVHDAEGEGSDGGYLFYREVEPGAVGGVGVVANPQLVLGAARGTI